MAKNDNDTLRAAIDATMHGFLQDSGLAVSTKNPRILSSHLTDDCVRHLVPSNFPTLYPFVKPVETVAEYEARMSAELNMMEYARVEVISSVADPVARKGSVYARHSTKFQDSPFVFEIGWFFDFTEDGRKITKIHEFIDTLTASKMIEKMALGGGGEEEGAD